MRLAILDPFSGIAGDMTLGALLAVGLDADWLRALPATLGLADVTVAITRVKRADLACFKVDFSIPPQPHGRHIHAIQKLVAQSGAPERVRALADAAFLAIGSAEAEIHGTTIEKVHLHEVGAVDAILDVVGVIWGLAELGVTEVRCGVLRVGDGTVKAAHGLLPVPAPATLKLLEGHQVSPGPEGAGELVTPTGAALVRVLSSGPPPAVYTPVRSGFGAGTKEFVGRANALRIIIADVDDSASRNGREELVLLACDVDDMSPEYLAAVADRARADGALDVILLSTTMKKGRAGTRFELLCRPVDADRFERLLLMETTSIGVRRSDVSRVALARRSENVEVLGHSIAVKIVDLPDGGTRAKPEFDDVQRIALATGRRSADIYQLALGAAERL
ncbi:MAG: nickel pincer cofactor biosynthesis protein LarC [Gemmatimonadaceae bacterium]